MAETKKPATRTTTTEATDGFTAEERSAMKERAKELRTAKRAASKDEEPGVLAKIAELPDSDRAMAERLHAVIRASAPSLSPKLWYGQPAYARDGKIVCFFQPASKFKTRYSTLGFSDEAHLDDGSLWPTAFALAELTEADEAKIAELVKRAAG